MGIRVSIRRERRYLVGFFLLAIIALTACRSNTQDVSATPTAIPTPIIPSKPVYEVQRGDVIKTLAFNGRILPVMERELFFRESGFVHNVYVARGEMVAEGELLAELEELNALQRQLALQASQIAQAEINLENAQLTLELFELDVPKPDALTEATALQAIAEAELAVFEAERANNLTRSTGSQAQNELQQNLAAANLSVAEAQLAKAQQEWERLQANPIPPGTAQALAIRENEVELAQIALNETRLNQEALQIALENAQIMAPFAGEVLSVNIADGSSAEAFAPVIVIADTSNLEIVAQLQGMELAGLTTDMPVTVELLNQPGEAYAGTIRSLPILSGSSNAEDSDLATRISLDSPISETGFEMNDLVRVTVELERRENVLWLPPQAIRSFEGRNFVVIQDENGQRRVDATPGLRAADRVEILQVEGVENLSEGQVVIGP